MLERVKLISEILAIFIGGLFIFFTWGLDYLAVSEAKWELKFVDTGSYPSELHSGTNLLCNNKNCDEPSACIFQGSLEVKNVGNRSISLGETTLKYYLIDRPTLEGVTDASSSYFLSLVCDEDDLRSDCEKPVKTVPINEIDPNPLFPEQTAIRSFLIEINEPDSTTERSIVDFLQRNVLFVTATQPVTAENVILPDEQFTSVGSFLDSNLCDFRIQKSSGS